MSHRAPQTFDNACLDMRADTHSGKHMIHRMKLTIEQSALTMHCLSLSKSLLPAKVSSSAFFFVLVFLFFVSFFACVLPFLHDYPVSRWHGPWPRTPITDIAREPIRLEVYLKINCLSVDSPTYDLFTAFYIKFDNIYFSKVLLFYLA